MKIQSSMLADWIEELGMQLEDVIAKLDEEIRQQWMKRVQQSLNISENNPVNR